MGIGFRGRGLGFPADPVTSVCFPGVCAVNGLLYVVGGDDGSCNLASVEYYNPVTDKWTLLPTNMSTGRSYAGQWVSASGVGACLLGNLKPPAEFQAIVTWPRALLIVCP